MGQSVPPTTTHPPSRDKSGGDVTRLGRAEYTDGDIDRGVEDIDT